MTETLNIKFTLAGLNKVLETLGALPNSSDTYPLFLELQKQGKAELERISAQKSAPPETAPYPTQAAAQSEPLQSP